MVSIIQSFEKYSDLQLIEFVRNNENKALAYKELYRRYSNKIWLYCKRVFGDVAQAEDIFQDTFINFLKAIENNYNIDNVQGYLLKIARNNSINHKNTATSNIIFEELIEDFHSSNQDEKYESKEMLEIINKALDLLADEYKEAFVLQIYEGLSYQEIANLTNVPVTTVRNRVVRAKMKMREILAPIFKEKIN